MQARAERAVCICKDHVCCLLKSGNAPARGPTQAHLCHGKKCATPTSTSTWSAIFTHGAASL
eukprot:853469-Rhodomonas_salina.1